MNTCLNCKHARFEMTEHKPPRPNPHQPGRCTYHVILPIVPRAYHEDANELERRFNGRHSKSAIWSSSPYAGCPAWEAVEAEKVEE